MDYVAKALHRLTYDRLAYEPIREDFLSWYRSAYLDLSLSEKMDKDNGELVEMAIEARTEALTYEPETGLNTAIRVTSEAEAILKFWATLLSIAGVSIGGLLAGVGLLDVLPTVVSLITSVLGGGIFLVLGSTYPIYRLVKHTVETNSELIRLYNRELVVSIGRIRENERWDDKVVAFYLHHSGLCSTTTLPVIIILGVIRVVSPQTYGLICQRLRRDISEYYEDNFWKMLGKEYARVRKQRRKVRAG